MGSLSCVHKQNIIGHNFPEGRRWALSNRDRGTVGHRLAPRFHGSTVERWATVWLNGSTVQSCMWELCKRGTVGGQPYGHGLPVHGPVRRLPPYSNFRKTSTTQENIRSDKAWDFFGEIGSHIQIDSCYSLHCAWHETNTDTGTKGDWEWGSPAPFGDDFRPRAWD